MKVSLLKYVVPYRGKTFMIIMYPELNNLWFYNAHPAEETYDCSGSIDSMKIVATAFALNLLYPQMIVWLPIKRNNIEGDHTFNMVLSRHCLQSFRPSDWYKLKPLLKRRKPVKFLFQYDEQKLIGYVNNVIEPQYHMGKRKEDIRLFQQKEFGNTVFCRYSTNDLYLFHKSILDSIETMAEEPERYTCSWSLGWIYSNKLVEELMREENEA